MLCHFLASQKAVSRVNKDRRGPRPQAAGHSYQQLESAACHLPLPSVDTELSGITGQSRADKLWFQAGATYVGSMAAGLAVVLCPASVLNARNCHRENYSGGILVAQLVCPLAWRVLAHMHIRARTQTNTHTHRHTDACTHKHARTCTCTW